MLLALILVTVSHWTAYGAEINTLLKTLKSVGPQAAGNRQAAPAWTELIKADAGQLPAILAGLDDANPLAANWIRTAVDTVAERRFRRDGTLPAAELERFVLDTSHAPRARRLAYEWLCHVDRSAPERLLPGMLDDPSLEMRRDAVARRIDEAARLVQARETDQAVPLYQEALTAARDADQVALLADRLRELGREVNLPRHFGFVLRWNVIGPFDNTDGRGFAAVYPPERGIDLQASYDGKHGKVQWLEHIAKDEYATVDFNRALQHEKAVVGYATSEFVSRRRQEVDLRVTSLNAVKVWLNGQLVARHEVYHAGSQMDQYTNHVIMQPGRNTILVKVCQNAITPEWADPWGFQLRVCDTNGTAVLSADRNP